MTEIDREIVERALTAKTPADAAAVQRLIATAHGGEHLRPLGDRWGNFGLLASSADYDLKLVELVTNMQDAVIERAAISRFGSRSDAARALTSPHEAARKLFGADGPAILPEVTFWESDPPASKSHRLTIWFDDRGTGMSPRAVPETIFQLGGSNKEDAPYLQGAFGLGGELMYRNSRFVVLVTRRAPELLRDGEEDRIAVAVVEWRAQTKTQTAVYLVDREWVRAGDVALPWSCPAATYPELEPGTHIALISYGTGALYRKREGDERSFDTIVNTRLFRPLFPTRWRNYLARGSERATTLRGLHSRLDTTTHALPTEHDQLPFVYNGTQYFLDTTYVVFAGVGEAGERRKFVAKDHALIFTSNGQVQAHWTPAEFKAKTTLKKLDSRILVEINLDALPVEARTALFTPDRAETVKSEVARKLDREVANFLDNWDSLVDHNQAILQEQLRAASDVSTRAVSDQIRRAISARGFGGGPGTGGTMGPGGRFRSGGGAGGRPRKPAVLLDDPTRIDGPSKLILELGKTRTQRFEVNAKDEFFARNRGELKVEPGDGFPFDDVTDILTIGRPHGGLVRLNFAIPDGYDQCEFDLALVLRGWSKSSGGAGPDLVHPFRVQLVTEIPGRGDGAGRKPTGSQGGSSSAKGANAVLLWVSGTRRGWQPSQVGELERVPANQIAAEREEYRDLQSLGDEEVECISLNVDFGPLVKYLGGRAASLSQSGTDLNKNRYAVGVGVQMLALAEEEDRLAKSGHAIDPVTREAFMRSAARGVLAVLPEFDRLARLADDLDAE